LKLKGFLIKLFLLFLKEKKVRCIFSYIEKNTCFPAGKHCVERRKRSTAVERVEALPQLLAFFQVYLKKRIFFPEGKSLFQRMTAENTASRSTSLFSHSEKMRG